MADIMKQYNGVDLTGRFIKCVTTKYADYTFGKLYPITSRFVNTKGEPTNFEVNDDEQDHMSIEFFLRKPTKFILLDEGIC